jgi:hypothetical protein
MARIRIPPPDVPAIDLATGRWTQDWYDVLKGLERLGLLDLVRRFDNRAGKSSSDDLEQRVQQIHPRSQLMGLFTDLFSARNPPKKPPRQKPPATPRAIRPLRVQLIRVRRALMRSTAKPMRLIPA